MKNIIENTVILLFYEKRSSCSCGCRLLAVTTPAVIFSCGSVLSTTPLRRGVGSLAVLRAFWWWMVLLGSIRAPWFPGGCMFLTMWTSLIIQHVTTILNASSIKWLSRHDGLVPNGYKPLKKSPARKLNVFWMKNRTSYVFINSHLASPDARGIVFIGAGLVNCGSKLMKGRVLKRMIARCGQYMIY